MNMTIHRRRIALFSSQDCFLTFQMIFIPQVSSEQIVTSIKITRIMAGCSYNKNSGLLYKKSLANGSILDVTRYGLP